ncbi:MAG TPA: hypothetical protein V6D23_27290 [Candidatus Obscuribacterales bacterium]
MIPLRSVLNDLVLAGTVDLPEGYKPRNVDVYLALPAKKGEVPQEVYLYSQTLKAPAGESTSTEPAASATPKPARSREPKEGGKEGTKEGDSKKQPVRFRLVLPNLEKNQSYHVQLTAADADGGLSYHHLYNLSKSDEEIKAAFLTAPEGIELEGEEVNAVPAVPNFSWEAVNAAELYHLTLEAGSGAMRRIVWEAWTRDTQIRYPLSSRTQRLREQTSYTVSVEAIKGLHPVSTDLKKQYALPTYQAIWTDLARVTHTPFEVVE